jgi:hypothetical protein
MESTNSVLAASLADEINRLHSEAEKFRDGAVSQAGQACRSAIECGILLQKIRDENDGEFGLWVEANCKFCERTARNYMTVARKYRKALAEGSVDFQSLKELYITTGIMPAPEEHEPNGAPPLPPLIRFTTGLGKILDKLQQAEKETLRQWCLETLKRL